MLFPTLIFKDLKIIATPTLILMFKQEHFLMHLKMDEINAGNIYFHKMKTKTIEKLI